MGNFDKLTFFENKHSMVTVPMLLVRRKQTYPNEIIPTNGKSGFYEGSKHFLPIGKRFECLNFSINKFRTIFYLFIPNSCRFLSLVQAMTARGCYGMFIVTVRPSITVMYFLNAVVEGKDSTVKTRKGN